ncbi:MAG: hypothetical protein ABFQ95_07450, partial [Pseudomonadota bacterium]
MANANVHYRTFQHQHFMGQFLKYLLISAWFAARMLCKRYVAASCREPWRVCPLGLSPKGVNF